MGKFLPDVDGKFRIKVEHSATPNSSLFVSRGIVDCLDLTINGIKYQPVSALEYGSTDILEKVLYQDNFAWEATNKWAVFEFDARP